MQFLDLGIEDAIPNAKIVWLFREQLTKHGLTRVLFEKFENYLSREGYQAQEGQIVDAMLVPVPKQRNSRKEGMVQRWVTLSVSYQNLQPLPGKLLLDLPRP